MSKITTIDVVASADYEIPDFNYELITNEEDREWAEYAAGSIRFDLGQAVLKVLTAGNMLMEAKSRLPHGQYLPWVEQACGLKLQYAQKLAKAAEWVNAAHERTFGIRSLTPSACSCSVLTPHQMTCANGSWSAVLLVIHQAGRMFNSGSGRHLAHGNQDQWRR
jgi:hypothetical protein